MSEEIKVHEKAGEEPVMTEALDKKDIDPEKARAELLESIGEMIKLPENEKNGAPLEAIHQLARQTDNFETVKSVIQLFNENRGLDSETLKQFISVASRYGRTHGFSEIESVGFQKNIL